LNKRNLENVALTVLAVVGIWFLVKGYREGVRYHIKCTLGVYTICDFWTTNLATVEEWRHFKPPPDSPWVLDANRVSELLGAAPPQPLTPDDLTLGVYTNLPYLRFR